MKPERFYHVSQSQLSIARHFGGIIFNGARYIYNSADDSLTLEDVYKAEKKKVGRGDTPKQEGMF